MSFYIKQKNSQNQYKMTFGAFCNYYFLFKLTHLFSYSIDITVNELLSVGFFPSHAPSAPK